MKGALFFLRLLFVVTSSSVSYQISVGITGSAPFAPVNIFSILLGTLISIGIILLEIQYSSRFISAIFTIILGLLIGFIASNLFIQAFLLVPHIQVLRKISPSHKAILVQESLEVGVTFFFCYLSLVVLFKTKNRYKILIPFIELNKEEEEKAQHFIIDTSVIIDGRILGMLETKLLNGIIIIPKFIIQEIQTLADTSDRSKRIRGRRGLEILTQIEQKPNLQIRYDNETYPQIKKVDDKLICLAKRYSGILVTNDFNLNKIATLQHIDVININAVANALRPPVLPGNVLQIRVIKQGEDPNQGIGYLEDGTVVVIDNGWGQPEKIIDVVVTNVLQTNVGRMIFAKYQ
ncbi:MAG TPA: PIN domain-containing protein [Planctomycetota bacterium]|nr:PIN domain-containing protein [Planctomycetota bacterium]